MLRRERDNAHPSATGSGAVAYPQSENPAQGLDAWKKKKSQSCAGAAAEFTSVFFCWLRMFRCRKPWFLSLKLASISCVVTKQQTNQHHNVQRRPSGSH